MLTFDAVAWAADGVPVLAGVDLHLRRGELVVLLGPSGVGKTTMLRLAAGLVRPIAGQIDGGGLRTSMVFQEPRLLPWESAVDNVALALTTYGISRREARGEAGRWLLRLGLRTEDFDKRPAQLSGGMQSRVAIARAFVATPDLVLLDEPFAALDPARRHSLQTSLRDLVDAVGASALFVTHDPAEAVRLADRIAILSGAPARISAELINRPVVDPAEIWSRVATLARHSAMASLWGGFGTVRATPRGADRGSALRTDL